MVSNKKRLISTVISTVLLSFSTFAAAAELYGADDKAIKTALADFNIQVESIADSPMDGLYEVVTNRGVVYTNQDATYFISGQMIQNGKNGPQNLTEKAIAKRNKAKFAQANVEGEMIVYPAKDEKYIVNVFTDTTCGYCRKLHDDIANYNKLGITIRYLAFPRSGEQSPNLQQMSAIWCAKDRPKAMNDAKSYGFKENSTQCLDLVRRHMALGAEVGMTGTPGLLLQDGTLLPGYIPPKQLLEILEQDAKLAS